MTVKRCSRFISSSYSVSYAGNLVCCLDRPTSDIRLHRVGSKSNVLSVLYQAKVCSCRAIHEPDDVPIEGELLLWS